MTPHVSSATPASSASPRASLGPRATLGLAVLLGAAALVPIWALERFPGQDTPNHLYTLHVLRHLDQSPFSEHFRFHAGASTNFAYHALTLAAAPLVGEDAAHRLFLSLYLVAFFAGALYLAGSWKRERAALGLLVFPFAFNWCLTLGFYNFCFTLPIFCFGLGLLLRHPAPRLRHRAWLMVLGLLAAIGHPFGLLCLGAACLTAMPSWRERFLAGAALLPALFLIGLGVAGSAGGAGLSWSDFPSPLYSLGTSFSRFALPFGPGELATAIPAYLLLAVAALATVRWHLRRTQDADPTRVRALRTTGFLTLLFFILPEGGLGFWHVSTRLAPLVFLSIPAWAGLGWLSRRRTLFTTAVLVLGLGHTALFFRSAHGIGEELAEYTAGVDAVPRGSTLLPLNFAGREGRVLWPLLHGWGYYGIERAAISPYTLYAHAERPASWLAYRSERPALPVPDELLPQRLSSGEYCDTIRSMRPEESCASLEVQALEGLARSACAYDAVLTWSAPPALAPLLTACLERAFTQGRLAIYRRVR